MRDDKNSAVLSGYRRAVFLDRDGTINADTHYPHKPEDLIILPNALEAMRILASLGAAVIVVTNQSGIGLGMYKTENMEAFNAELKRQVQKAGGRIDAFYYCPHLEKKNLAEGEAPCGCSKPNPGMLLEAAADFGVDLSASAMVGDKTSDVAAGQAAGCAGVLVLTGKAGKEEGALLCKPDGAAEDLLAAALKIRSRFSEN